MTIDRRDFMKCGALSTLGLAVDKMTATAEQDSPIKPGQSSQTYNSRRIPAAPADRAPLYARRRNRRDLYYRWRQHAVFHKRAVGLSERLFALVLPAKGELGWVAPAFEKGRALDRSNLVRMFEPRTRTRTHINSSRPSSRIAALCPAS
jgi:hypothetical protein